MGRKSLIPVVEKKLGKPIGDILTDLVDQGADVPDIVKELGLGKSMVYSLINEFDLKLKSKSDSQSYFEDSDSEFTKLIDSFIITKEVGGKTEATIRFYKSNLLRFVWWLRENGIPLQLRLCFNPDVIRRFLYYVKTSPVRFGGHSHSARKQAGRSTVDAYFRTLSAFGLWLIIEGKLRESPTKKVEKPGLDKVVVPDIPDKVLFSILNSLDNSLRGLRSKAIIWIFLDSGVRLRELVNMAMPDLNLETGLIKVFGKGRKERIVRIGKTALGHLKEYLKLRKGLARTDRLFITVTGKPLGYYAVRKMFTEFQTQFPGVPLHPHAFRHKFALEILRNSGNLVALQMLGGWSDLNMPRHYAGAIEQEEALKVHETASPADSLAKRNGD